MVENLRPGTLRAAGAVRRLGVSAAITVALVFTMGALVSPAAAIAVAGGTGSTTLVGLVGVAAPVVPDRRSLHRVTGADTGVQPGGGENAELDLVMVATIGGPAFAMGSLFAIGFLLAWRPHLERQRAMRPFRTELHDCDVTSICASRPPTPER